MQAASNFYQRVFALVVAAILGYALWRIFEPFLDSIAWAAFLTFLLFPINVRLRRKLGDRRTLAAAVLTVLAPVVLLLPLTTGTSSRAVLGQRHGQWQWNSRNTG